MSQYPITEAQWRVVSTFPKVNRDLRTEHLSPSKDDHPVNDVYWQDVVEFCDRLSQKTGRSYRLPSEAEWEYACRAGTETAYHFGPTITKEYANYEDNGTIPVGDYGVANNFGLYDMHGNIWKWCQDEWHDNYEGAPSDGSA
ncbi:MAG: formylglycine-generating enzyme family protein [Cyanobacteria bacterium P01_F01_bin.150]